MESLRFDAPGTPSSVIAPSVSEVATGVQVVRRHDEALRGTTRLTPIGDVLVAVVEGEHHEVLRTARSISRNARTQPGGSGCLRLHRMLEGEIRVLQDGRHGSATGTQLVCVDSTRPYRIVLPGPFRMVELLVPHRRAGLPPGGTRGLTAVGWSGRQGVGALLSPLLAGLTDHRPLSDPALVLLGGGVADLTAALLAERHRDERDEHRDRTGEGEGEEAEAARRALMLRVQTYVREHLADPDLTPASVADHHNVSLRYLQKIFQEHGTSPARWIRDERLTRCRAELGNPRLDHVPVAVIGERSGLYGASHFSRLFRGRFGVTPRDYRKGRRHPARSP
ncbi:helix-turn-helix domain-containing protein [Streptomyces sp. NPDC047928]|uniref:helix-turn-helix domain-containing protein n=1 Tax=unclassified Streptomyces TaxID=2593676 RepID=UPI00371E11A5